MTDGGGVDYSFECTGINDVLREAFLSTQDVCRRAYLYLSIYIYIYIYIYIAIKLYNLESHGCAT
jgi:hypothetical protein